MACSRFAVTTFLSTQQADEDLKSCFPVLSFASTASSMARRFNANQSEALLRSISAFAFYPGKYGIARDGKIAPITALAASRVGLLL